jgi:hypothetical protein
MTDPVHRLYKAAQALVDSISHDEHGTMIGGKYQGGNGGLISPQTIVLCDEVRRALNAMVGGE